MENKKSSSGFVKNMKQYAGPLSILVLLVLILWVTTDKFMTTNNMVSVLQNICVNALLSAGVTCVIIIGCIDLSIGSTVAACSVIAVVLNTSMGWNVWLSVLIAILAGGLVGAINGGIRAATMLPPFIITLATQQAIRGVAYIFTGGSPIVSTDATFNAIGKNSFLGLPVMFYIMLVSLIIVGLILARTRLGRHMYAVGGNMEAAKHSGISYAKVSVVAYTIMGLLAGLSGVIMASRLSSGQPTIGGAAGGTDYSTDAIAAAVIGGTAFSGGFGSVFGSFLGACIIGVLNSGMTHLKVDSYWQMVAKGILILLAVYYDSIKGKIKIGKKKAAA